MQYSVESLTEYFGVVPTTGQMYLTVSQVNLPQDSYVVSTEYKPLPSETVFWIKKSCCSRVHPLSVLAQFLKCNNCLREFDYF